MLKFSRVQWGAVVFDFLLHAKHLNAVEKSALADIVGEAAVVAYKQFIYSLFVEDTLQSTKRWRKAVDQLCITSLKMTVHVILSDLPWFSSCLSSCIVLYIH